LEQKANANSAEGAYDKASGMCEHPLVLVCRPEAVMIHTTSRARLPAADLKPRIKIWLERDGTYAFGLGISQILQAIEASGSIKQAASDLGKSYRHVWARVKEAEKALGQPLVDTKVGGSGTQRSSLTDRARELVTAYLALRSRFVALAEEEFSRLFPRQLS
jgi:molybdate transport system regulatory protein